MNDKEKETLEESVKRNLGQNIKTIDENDTFNFHCVQCGQCCMNRRDIILNPFDVYNGAKYLGITCKEFFSKYCYTTLGANSKIPMVLLETTDNGYCPLLKFDVKDGGKFKCTINPAKPGACSNHPIGVCFSINQETNDIENIQYIKTEQCPNSKSDEEHVVKDWVKPYTDHLDEINASHHVQHYITSFIDPKMFLYMCKYFTEPILQEKDESKITEEDKKLFTLFTALMHVVIDSTINIGYLSYDTDKPFVEQTEGVLKELKDIYKHCKHIYEKTKQSFEESPAEDIGVEYDKTFESFLKIVVGREED